MKEEAFYTRNGWKNMERKSKAQYAFSNSHFQSIFRSPLTAYHSRQVLLLRSEQENHLDQVLKRRHEQAGVLQAGL